MDSRRKLVFALLSGLSPWDANGEEVDVRTSDLPDRRWRVAQVAVHSEMDWHTLPVAESLVGDGNEVAHEEAIACAMKGEPSVDQVIRERETEQASV